MTCRDVMTSNPSCSLTTDSAATAAQIMKREDVGSVPVVSDHNTKRLVGIVTDRDLAIKAIAEGRDPHNTRLDQVMTSNPVTCRPDDDVMSAVKAMADHQIRRIPVVDHNNSLVGIVAQADIARTANDEHVGEMVEEISEPAGAGEWRGRSGGYGSENAAFALAIGAVSFGVGAGLMYLMDPTGGRRRRAVLRDKTASAWHTSQETMRKRGKDLRNRATGTFAEARLKYTNKSVDDETLVERVRSKAGRSVSHPHAIQVSASNGTVSLSGPILADEAEHFVSSVREVPGVVSVENMLELHESPGGHPSLQGGERKRRRFEESEQTWSPALRILGTALGGGLLVYGLKSKNRAGKASASLGLGLLARGITNREFGSFGHIGNLRSMVGF